MRPSVRAGALGVVTAAVLSACGDGGPPARGFGSRQLASLRDSTFSFLGSRGDVVLYSTGTDPTTFLAIDVRTGAVTTHDATYADITVPQYTFPSDPNARYHCSYGADAMGDIEFRIDDGQTAARTTVPGGTLAVNCPTDADPSLTIWRRGDAGLTLWTGAYDALQMAPVDLEVRQILQAVKSTDMTVNVLASRPAQPDALGIFAIDLTTFAVSDVVPPVLAGGAWAEGATAAGAIDSVSLFADPNQFVGGVFAVGDHFGYWRAMGDGGATLFVGPFASGPARELALFHRDGDAPTIVPMVAAEGSATLSPLPPVWRWTAAGSPQLAVWDDGRRRLIACPSPFTAEAMGMASADRGKLAFFVEPRPFEDVSGVYAPFGPLLLVDATSPAGGPAACNLLETGGVSAAGFSPDDSTLFWLVPQTYPQADLWLAAPDGGAARIVGQDQIEGWPNAPHFVGPSQLEIDISADLLWIDTHDDPVVTHPIVERVRGGVIDRGRWLIIGYDGSAQDGNADLGIVERANGGNKRLISPDVVTFFSPDIRGPYSTTIFPSPLRAADDPIRLIYLVRGRNPSPQDGLWVATINASDIP